MQLFWNIGSFNNMNLLKDQTGVGRYQGQKSKSTNTNEMSLHQHMTCRFAAVKKDEKMSECPYLEGAIKLLVGWSA